MAMKKMAPELGATAKAAKKYRRGGSISGKVSVPKNGRYARGGAMTPKSPLSGAGSVSSKDFMGGKPPAKNEGGKGGDSD